MTVILDASPLIFLSKVNLLEVIIQTLDRDVHLSRLVKEELLSPRLDHGEQKRLEAFLDRCQIHNPTKARSFATAMSQADNDSLSLAIHLKATILLADDRILRLMASNQGIRPLGTLGLLMMAKRKGVLSKKQTLAAFETLVGQHGFRISIEVYQDFTAALRN